MYRTSRIWSKASINRHLTEYRIICSYSSVQNAPFRNRTWTSQETTRCATCLNRPPLHQRGIAPLRIERRPLPNTRSVLPLHHSADTYHTFSPVSSRSICSTLNHSFNLHPLAIFFDKHQYSKSMRPLTPILSTILWIRTIPCGFGDHRAIR